MVGKNGHSYILQGRGRGREWKSHATHDRSPKAQHTGQVHAAVGSQHGDCPTGLHTERHDCLGSASTTRDMIKLDQILLSPRYCLAHVSCRKSLSCNSQQRNTVKIASFSSDKLQGAVCSYSVVEMQQVLQPYHQVSSSIFRFCNQNVHNVAVTRQQAFDIPSRCWTCRM